MKLGFIGYGNMASAIVGGILKKGIFPPENLMVTDRQPEKMAAAASLGLQVENLENIKKHANMIFICVKPQDFASLLKDIKSSNNRDKTYVSIAAGITTEFLQKHLGGNAAIVRVMPNTPLLLGRGTSAVCRNTNASAESYTLVKQIFASAGTVYEIPEDRFNEVLNLNGSAPAYIFLFAKTIADYAADHGIPYDTALAMFSDTLRGAAKMLQRSGKSADELIRNVSSPGGTTLAALEAMEREGFIKGVQAGCAACVKRGEELANQ